MPGRGSRRTAIPAAKTAQADDKALSASPAVEYASPRDAVARAVETAYPLMTAIAITVTEGTKPGSISADPTSLGLPPLSSYANPLVRALRYDKQGNVTLDLANNKSLGTAAGKKIQFALFARPGSLKWAYSYATTVQRDMLPKLP